MDVRAILFDFDHTLGVDNRLEFDVLHGLVHEACGAPPAEDDVIACLESFRSGRVPLDDALSSAFARWGCPPPRIAMIVRDFRRRALEEAPQRVRPMPGAHQTVLELARRAVPIAIMTNGWRELQHLKARLIDFPGPVYSSEELGAWKPAREAFERVVSLLELAPTTTLYVGDSPETDVAGAKNAGLLAAWADLEGKTYPENVMKPDIVITALVQLLGLAPP